MEDIQVKYEKCQKLRLIARKLRQEAKMAKFASCRKIAVKNLSSTSKLAATLQQKVNNLGKISCLLEVARCFTKNEENMTNVIITFVFKSSVNEERVKRL